jgi:serpin B
LPQAKSTVARNLNPQVSAADLGAVANGNIDFALKAFNLLAPSGAGNTVFSPYSVTQAVALAAAGANGNTLNGIDQALSFSLPQARLNPALNELNLQLDAKTSGGYDIQSGQAPNLTIANAIWAQRGFSLQPAYLDTLAQNFGAGVNQVDFAASPVAARMDINAWAAQQTNGMVTNLIPMDAIADTTRLMLTNAVWFKGGWSSPFNAAATQNAPFHAIDGSATNAPFMNQIASLPYFAGNGVKAVDIPYVGNNLSMLIVMPDEGTMPAYQASLTAASYHDLLNSLKTDGRVALSLPKFSFASLPDLGTTLQALGMRDAFDAAKADFSGMDGGRDLSIKAIFQQAKISVDEQGTEAAAATAVMATIVSAEFNQPQPVPIVVDHPFLFFLRDRQSGTILFMGKVTSIPSSN